MNNILLKFSIFSDRNPRFTIFLLGGLTSLSFAPFFFFPAGILGFSGLLFCLERPQFADRPFFYGWLFGFGHFTVGLYWLGHALKTIGLWYLMPLGWFGLPAYLALFAAVAIGLTCIWSRSPLARCLLFSCLWSLGEYARGHVLTGFPWNLNGYTWTLDVLQITSIMGIYGLSLLTTLLFVSIASRSKVYILSCVFLFASLFGWGQYRLSTYPTERTGINMRLVQASIPQNLKWLADHFEGNFNKYLGLSSLDAERPLKAIIWSESSIPTFIMDYPVLKDMLASVTPEKGYMIVGGPRHGLEGEIYTSMFIFNEQSQLTAFYDKSHLVPFGEYFPFRNIFKSIGKLTAGDGDYSPGNGIQTLAADGLSTFSALVCYEAIFPGAVVTMPRPGWMLNQTNDAWYGYTTGPFQHFHIVRTRAIEEGIPLVRSANNGISAVVDPVGRITESLGLNEVGIIDFDLPKPLLKPTFYSQHKDSVFFGFIIILAILAFMTRACSRFSLR